MKKFLALFLAIIMMISVFAGCSKKKKPSKNEGLPNGLTGTEVAKLLLADERLNSGVLKGNGNIFDKGARDIKMLSERAIENLGVQYLSASAEESYDGVVPISEVYKGVKFGKLQKDGDTFKWSEFDEYNNSYDYFQNITNGIVESANVAAELIDNIKKNVRVVDKWVQVDPITKYYLHVEENSELLCEYRDEGECTFVTVCMRSKNSEGKDVYELYRSYELYTERMTYIPGERYERSSINSHGEDVQRDFFVADNSKGYWETYVVGVAPEHYNVSYFIMKDDICYDAFYDAKTGVVPYLKAMSADRATDIFNITDYGVEIKFSGFDGIDRVEAPASAVEFNSVEKFANLTDPTAPTIYLTNGKTINYGDTFVDGKVTVQDIRVSYIGMAGHIGELSLRFNSEALLSKSEKMELTRAFILEVGLECRRDLDETIAAVERAFDDVDDIIKYFRWNGVTVRTNGDIGSAIELEMKRFDSMRSYYENVKDAPSVDYNDVKQMELNMSFAPIINKTVSNSAVNGLEMTFGSIALTVNDTLLFVKDTEYKLAFAFLQADGSLVHMYDKNEQKVIYKGEKEFTVSSSNLTVYIPVMPVGEYTVVAYIATSEGIRSSEFVQIGVDRVEGIPLYIDDMKVSAQSSGGKVTVQFEETFEFTMFISSAEDLNYSEFYDLLATATFEHGTPADALVEYNTGTGFLPLNGDETKIPSGSYRMAYTTLRDGVEKSGHVYFEYYIQKEPQ